MKRHIVYFAYPYAVLINPVFAIVRTLIRRGYRVTCVTSGRYIDEFSRLGADVLQLPFGVEPKPPAVEFAVAQSLATVSHHLEVNPPDLILHDPYFCAALIIAARHGIPSIRVTPLLAFDGINRNHPNVPLSFKKLIEDYLGRVRLVLNRHGVYKYDDPAHGRSMPTIYLYTPEFQLTESAEDARSVYAGRCAAERPCEATWRKESGELCPSVLISTSTSLPTPLQYFRSCLKAVTDLGWHAVIAPGNSTDLTSLELPSNSEIVKDVPQILIMPHVDLMICLGGMATTMEAMYHGLPLLMLTHRHLEAEVYADNVQKQRVGIHLRGNSVSAEEIKDHLIVLSQDAELQMRVKEMQGKVKRSPGAEEAVNWIEDVL